MLRFLCLHRIKVCRKDRTFIAGKRCTYLPTSIAWVVSCLNVTIDFVFIFEVKFPA